MQKWTARIRRALLMGLAWAIVWVPVSVAGGLLMVGELEPEIVGGPLYAGFLCGAIFSAVAGIASGRRRVEELSFAQAAAWGAVTGMLVGMLPFVLGDQVASQRPLWVLPVSVIGAMTVLAALSASASLPVARWLTKNMR